MLKRIKGTDYVISDDGVVYITEVIVGIVRAVQAVHITDDGRGYKKVFLMVNGKRVSKKIHRLVAETFIPNPDHLPMVNHIDGDKTNNNVSNLEWCTYAYNSKHALKLGSKKSYSYTIAVMKNNKIVACFSSLKMTSKMLNIDYRGLCNAVQTGKVFRGYRFRNCEIRLL